MEKNVDMISFGIIANAGDSRSLAFQALQEAKAGHFDQADLLLQKSDEAAAKAHQAQTDLLFSEMNGEATPVNMLLVHSQDHLMNAMLASELIKELIEMYRKEAGKKQEQTVQAGEEK